MGFDDPDVGYAVKGRQVFAPPYDNLPNANIYAVTPDLFSTLRIPLLHGRNLTVQDTLNAPMVLLINQELARTVFPRSRPDWQADHVRL